MQQLDLGVRQLDEHDCDTVLWQRFGLANRAAEDVAARAVVHNGSNSQPESKKAMQKEKMVTPPNIDPSRDFSYMSRNPGAKAKSAGTVFLSEVTVTVSPATYREPHHAQRTQIRHVAEQHQTTTNRYSRLSDLVHSVQWQL